MILYIDATDYHRVIFALRTKALRKKSYSINPQHSGEILNKLEDFLRQHKVPSPSSAITKIVINKGPGSFTGVRISAAIAQALSLAWRVPLQAVPKNKFPI